MDRVEVDPPARRWTRHWIGGRRVASADTFETDPIDGTVLAQVARGGGAGRRGGGAARALPRLGSALAAQAGAILHRVADNVEAHIEELSQLETADNGSLLRRRGVMPRVVLNLRFFADYASTSSATRSENARAQQPRVLGPVRGGGDHHADGC